MRTADTTKSTSPARSVKALTAPLWNTINRLGIDISEAQHRRLDVAKELARVQATRDALAIEMNIAWQQGRADLPKIRARHDELSKAAAGVAQRLRAADEHLQHLHAELNHAHDSRGRLEILGGRSLNLVTLPSYSEDERLKALTAEAGRLRAEVADLTIAVASARDQHQTAVAHVRDVRIALHRGAAKQAQLDAAVAAATNAARHHEDAAHDLDAVREALQAAEADRDMHAGALRQRLLPALKNMHRVAVGDFVEALREAAIACEALWVVHDALCAAGETPQLTPWHELRVTDSKMTFFVREAIEAGYVNGD